MSDVFAPFARWSDRSNRIDEDSPERSFMKLSSGLGRKHLLWFRDVADLTSAAMSLYVGLERRPPESGDNLIERLD